MSLAALILLLVTLQRLGELVLARRNTARLLARGAIEDSPGHYPFIVALHASWLAALWLTAYDAQVSLFWLSIFITLQALRIWIIISLGDRWTTRIIVLPGAPMSARGPYKYMSHPNYVVVAAEMIVLPLALGQPMLGIVFFALNAIILSIRIRAESSALKRSQGATKA